MSSENELLRADYNIETPENVTFGYELAGIGSRFIGALVDTAILGVSLLGLQILLVIVLRVTGDLERVMSGDAFSSSASWSGGLVLALYALVNFVLVWGYFVLFELRWNGQTPGKRLAGIRVVQSGGRPAGALDVILRNLVRIIDFLPFGYAAGLVVMFMNREARRLGDYAGGTLVIKEPRRVTLASLRALDTEPDVRDGSPVPYPGARRLTPAEYALLRDVLDRRSVGSAALDEAVPRRLAQILAAHLGVTPSPDVWQFLQDIADSYKL